ncbi:hypothetical protein GGS23DRAFT_243634 [Durotheca rogersii]|uniref:uncharacterized protein n=1 Tax=Durotheca rogersii TaxID=419775 RepID=UPI00221E9248|nr:uncharacterized protein GGS23DRAFT_243634 [Durotheca rogersii]KAI5860292.1 hypothetical protein GGS23DRAFT_243634 [Durotheca rogersii]
MPRQAFPEYDLYATLKVDRRATSAEIKKAYREAILKEHPDKAGNTPESNMRASQINEAFTILGDLSQRAAYDRHVGNKDSRGDNRHTNVPGKDSHGDNHRTNKSHHTEISRHHTQTSSHHRSRDHSHSRPRHHRTDSSSSSHHTRRGSGTPREHSSSYDDQYYYCNPCSCNQCSCDQSYDGFRHDRPPVGASTEDYLDVMKASRGLYLLYKYLGRIQLSFSTARHRGMSRTGTVLWPAEVQRLGRQLAAAWDDATQLDALLRGLEQALLHGTWRAGQENFAERIDVLNARIPRAFRAARAAAHSAAYLCTCAVRDSPAYIADLNHHLAELRVSAAGFERP